jgi:molybdopterin-guanine dinucleotide biosynthesis protein A
MGRPKAWLPWGGRPMIAHVVGMLGRVVDEVVVVSSETLELPPLDARIVRDRKPEFGPLAGIREGLAEIESEFAFVTGTDAPFLESAFVEKLLSFECAAAAEVDGFVQTLSAVYPRAGLPIAEEMLEAGRMRPLHLLEALEYRKVLPQELPERTHVRGFNTPEEYLAAVREIDPNATATIEFQGQAREAAGRDAIVVPVGTLAEVLSRAASADLPLRRTDALERYRVSLDGRIDFRDGTIPIGPDEHLIIENN